MKNLLRAGAFAAMGFFVVGCGNPFANEIEQAVALNQGAASQIEWEQSPVYPEALFNRLRTKILAEPQSQEKIAADTCTALLNLDGVSLSIFENEIYDKINEPILSECSQRLLSQLEAYYQTERQIFEEKNRALSLKAFGSRIEFQPIVQKRDTSNGYFAVSGDVGTKEVVLTFDDGPSNAYTENILKSLKDVNAKVHFFSLGKNVRANPQILKRAAAEGHSIGSHSNTHACLGTSRSCGKVNSHIYSFDEAVQEIKAGHQAIYDTLGWVDPFFRFPYGEASSDLKRFLRANSVGEFFWYIDSEDWRAQSFDSLLSTTLAKLDKKGRGIILFHDIQRKTAEIMPAFLKELYFRGYSLVILQSTDETARFNSKLVKKRIP